MTVLFEVDSLRNILIASVIMCSVVLLFRFALGIGSIFHLIGAVMLGAGVYVLVLFRIDTRIWNELRDLVKTLGGF